MSGHNKPNYTIKSVKKAIELLDLFNRNQPELSLKEISTLMNIPKPTAFRLTYTLEECSFLQRNHSNGRFQLGLRLLYFGNLVTYLRDIDRVARPFLYELRNETKETVDITVLDGDQVLYIDKIESNQPLKAADSEIGKKLPIHCTASGKVLAAFTTTIIPNWPPEKLKSFTELTITDINDFMAELDTVRENGYAIDRGEINLEVKAIAAPIRNKEGTVIAALTVVAPANRIDDDNINYFIDKILETANKISMEFKYNNYIGNSFN